MYLLQRTPFAITCEDNVKFDTFGIRGKEAAVRRHLLICKQVSDKGNQCGRYNFEQPPTSIMAYQSCLPLLLPDCVAASHTLPHRSAGERDSSGSMREIKHSSHLSGVLTVRKWDTPGKLTDKEWLPWRIEYAGGSGTAGRFDLKSFQVDFLQKKSVPTF